MQSDIPSGGVRLRRTRDGGSAADHFWIYAGDIEAVSGTPAPGDVVDVYGPTRRYCGRGFYNPHSKIRVRLLTVEEEPIDEAFWSRRLAAAAALRARVVTDSDAYRLVHSEGDRLSGLIVDRYADVLVLQALSFGMDRRKDLLAELLMHQTKVSAVYARNDAKSRVWEGLPLEKGFVRGAGSTTVEIREGPARFRVDVERGQKTGWFCDQRENRQALGAFAKDAEVFDVFCHTGGFGIHAALQGARSVTGIDVSAEAVALATEHAALNGLADVCQYQTVDAFEELRAVERHGRRYDLVILDPPAFARSRGAVPHALAGYKDINLRALRLLRPEGFLATCSCSSPVSESALWLTILEAARDARRSIRLIESRSQGRDHPMLATMPETRYLKCFLVQAL